MNIQREKMRCLPMGGAAYFDGGDSSSSSTTQNTTNNYDQRQVNDASNGGIMAQGSGNTIVTTDQGAVGAGRDIALAGLNTNATNVAVLISAFESLATKNQQAMDANVSLTKSLAGTAQQAYSDATQQATGNKSLIVAGIAAVTIVAAVSLKKG